jgi:hypothetical protein
LFWLTVAEIPVHAHLAPSLWAVQYSTSRWECVVEEACAPHGGQETKKEAELCPSDLSPFSYAPPLRFHRLATKIHQHMRRWGPLPSHSMTKLWEFLPQTCFPYELKKNAGVTRTEEAGTHQ